MPALRKASGGGRYAIFCAIHEEEHMTVKQQLVKEIEELPIDAQEKVLKLVLFVKEEILVLREKISTKKKSNALQLNTHNL